MRPFTAACVIAALLCTATAVPKRFTSGGKASMPLGGHSVAKSALSSSGPNTALNLTYPVWSYDVFGENIYAVYSNGTGSSGKINVVAAFNAQERTGKPIWKLVVPTRSCQVDDSGEYLVCASTEDGVVLTVSAKTGAEQWTKDFPGIFPNPQLTLVGGVMYAVGGPASSSLLVAMDVKSGTTLWQKNITGFANIEVIPAADGQSVVTCPSHVIGSVSCSGWSSATGAALWTAKVVTATTSASFYEAVWDDAGATGRMYVVYDVATSASSTTWVVAGLDANNAAKPVEWSGAVTAPVGTNIPGCPHVVPDATSGQTFVWAAQGLTAVVTATGKRAWTFTTDNNVPLCPVAVVNSNIVGFTTQLDPVAVDTVSGMEQWVSNVPTRGLTVDADDNILSVDAGCQGADCTATITALDADNGSVAWSVSEAAVDADFTEYQVGDGVLCFASDKQLLCLAYGT